MNKITDLTPYSLDKDNVRDFDFIVVPAAIAAMEHEDGTSGFAVKTGDRYVGAITGRYTGEDEFLINSIYVVSDMRRRGIGSFMLDTLYGLMGDEDCTIRADVSHSLQIKDEGPLEEFLQNAGFEEYTDGEATSFLTELSSVAALKLHGPANPSAIIPFTRIADHIFENFNPSEYAFVPVPEGGFFAPEIDRDVSVGVVVKDRLFGFATIRRADDNVLIMDGLYLEKGGYDELISVLAVVREKLIKKYNPRTKIYFVVTNEKIGELIEKLFPPNCLTEGITIYKKERYDRSYDDAGVTLSMLFKEEGLGSAEGFYSA